MTRTCTDVQQSSAQGGSQAISPTKRGHTEQGDETVQEPSIISEGLRLLLLSAGVLSPPNAWRPPAAGVPGARLCHPLADEHVSALCVGAQATHGVLLLQSVASMPSICVGANCAQR